MTFEPNDRWENYYLEFAERVWWLIEVRGIRSYKTHHPSWYYAGENYTIGLSRNLSEQTCSIAVWSRFLGEGQPSVYEMGSEGGKGVILPDKIPPIIEGMRRDMVLDELASI